MMRQLLSTLKQNKDGIYIYDFEVDSQVDELNVRLAVARNSQDYLREISYSHSIPVMDREIEIFLKRIPHNGVVLDVGGGWGWHFRHHLDLRPDISVIILDMLIENLYIAKKLLRNKMKNLYLLHGTATDLPFPSNSIAGFWSVQTLQHVPEFNKAIIEAHRVLKVGGVFANYSLQPNTVAEKIRKMVRLNFGKSGESGPKFFLSKASLEQTKFIENTFGGVSQTRFTEVLFEPTLKITFPGKEGSLLGYIDSRLSSERSWLSRFARQKSTHIEKTVGT